MELAENSGSGIGIIALLVFVREHGSYMRNLDGWGSVCIGRQLS